MTQYTVKFFDLVIQRILKLFQIKLGAYLFAQFFYCNYSKRISLTSTISVSESFCSNLCRWQFLLDVCRLLGGTFSYSCWWIFLLQLCKWLFLLKLCSWKFLQHLCRWVSAKKNVGDNFHSTYAGVNLCYNYTGGIFRKHYADHCFYSNYADYCFC